MQNRFDENTEKMIVCHANLNTILDVSHDRKAGFNTKGVQKVRGKVPSYSYFVNQLN